MPNEQTTVPLFVASEVLTAADMNLSAGTGVPVFATTVTRDAGFGGAGEKVLAEGQLCYLSSTNVVQYYDGAAWATVGPSSAGGLVCVKAETAFSGATSITADGVFTSTYTNYLLLYNAQSTGNSTAKFFYRASGTSATGANYNYQQVTGAITTVAATRLAGAAFGYFGYTNGAFTSIQAMQIFGPQIAAPTSSILTLNQADGAYTAPYYSHTVQNHTVTTAYDGIEITNTSAATGSYAIYGYSKAV